MTMLAEVHSLHSDGWLRAAQEWIALLRHRAQTAEAALSAVHDLKRYLLG